MNTFVLDFETTGLNPYHNEIIEIAVKKFGTDLIYTDLVKPELINGRYVTGRIIDITGITNQDIDEKGISQITACENMFNFIKQNSEPNQPIYIMAHNGTTFDFPYLMMLVRRYKRHTIDSDLVKILETYKRLVYIDTLLLARFIFPDRSRYTQKSLCKDYKIVQNNAHRAYGDVTDLEKVYKLMMRDHIIRHDMPEDFIDNTNNAVAMLFYI